MRVIFLLMLLAISPLLIDRLVDVAPRALEASGVKAPAADVPALTYGQLPPLTVGQPFRATPSPGHSPGTFSVQGDLPPGIVLGEDGSLSGTPTAAGHASFRIAARHGSQSAAEIIAAVVRAPVEIRAPGVIELVPGAEMPEAIGKVSADGGKGAIEVGITDGPDWLAMDHAGNLRLIGGVREPGEFKVSVSATDAEGRKARARLTVRVVPARQPEAAAPDEPADTPGEPSAELETPWGVIPRSALPDAGAAQGANVP